MIVYVLTEEEKESLVGQKYTTDSFFNPIQDGNTPANWVISTEEVDQTTNEEFLWVKDLSTIDWVSPVKPIEENNP